MRKHPFFAFTLLALAVSSCNSNAAPKQVLNFAKDQYLIHSGERVTVEQNYNGIIYSFAGTVPHETTLKKVLNLPAQSTEAASK